LTLEELTECDLRLRGPAPAEALYCPDAAPLSDQELLSQWNQREREQDARPWELAKAAMQSASYLRLALFVFSFISGISLTRLLLKYEGLRLINISSFLGLVIGGQVLGWILLFLLQLLPNAALPQPWLRLLPRFVREGPSLLSLPTWRARLTRDLQLGGVLFNLGVLLSFFALVATRDLAFGWESTLITDSAKVHQLVSLLSAPWGGALSPSLEEIAATRIILLQGTAQQDASAAASWWPFLMICVAVYGLLPRTLLGIWATLNFRKKQETPSFASPQVRQLLYRLRQPPLKLKENAEDSADLPKLGKRSLPAFRPSEPLRADFREEQLPLPDQQALLRYLQQHHDLHFSPEARGRFRVIECWQPPLLEDLRELRELRAELGNEAEFLLLAVGAPHEEERKFFEAPDPRDVQIWEDRLADLNDARLGVLAWVEPS